MSFDIEEFKANTPAGFSRTSFFYMNVGQPGFWSGDTSFLNYLCSASQLPGVTIVAPNLVKWGYGPGRKFPVGVVHPDIPITVYSDGNGQAYDFFNQWLQNTVSYGQINSPINGAPFGTVNYPDAYRTTLSLYYMSETGDELIRCTFIEAFPVGMGSVGLNWAAQGNVATFSVVFNYRTFTALRMSVDGGVITPTSFSVGGILTDPLSITSGFIGNLQNASQSLLGAVRTAVSPILNTINKVTYIKGQAQLLSSQLQGVQNLARIPIHF